MPKKRKVIHLVCPSMRGMYDSRFASSRKGVEITFITQQYKKWMESGIEIAWELYSYDITDSFITDARQRAAENALNGISDKGREAPPADYLIMVDDDMVMPFDMIERLLEHKQAAIAPLFHHRKPPWLPLLMKYAMGSDKMKYVHVEPNKKLQEVDATGFGVICLDVNKTLRKMIPPYFFMSTDYGEDVFCCHKIRTESKQKIYVDTTLDVGHIAPPHVINREMAEHYRKQFGDLGDGMKEAEGLLNTLEGQDDS